MEQIKKWRWYLASLGCIAILVSLVSEHYVYKYYVPSTPVIVGLNFISHIGLALFTLGIITVALDLPEWKLYFQQRLAESTLQSEYLRTLDNKKLIELQSETIKAYFKDDKLDREGSFMKYFHLKIHSYLGSPYRENNQKIFSLIPTEQENIFTIDDSFSYRCRMVGGRIQENIIWCERPGRNRGFEECAITISCPPGHIARCANREKCAFVKNDCRDISIGKEMLEPLVDEYGKGYKYSLENFKDVDGLEITVKVKYKMDIKDYETWVMAYPTKGFTFTVRYPDNLKIEADVLGMESTEYRIVNKSGLYSISSESWVLANNGIIYQFTKTT